jgi:hypothetical protein
MGYDNTDRGALFKNKNRTKDTQPTHTGNLEVKCPGCGEVTPFWLSAWTKSAKESGMKFFSLAITQKEGGGNQSSPVVPDGQGDFDDDIPF